MVDSSEMKNTKEQVFGERGGKTKAMKHTKTIMQEPSCPQGSLTSTK
jgi:hypothetical protein